MMLKNRKNLSDSQLVKLVRSAYYKKHGHYPKGMSKNEWNRQVKLAENRANRTIWPSIARNL